MNTDKTIDERVAELEIELKQTKERLDMCENELTQFRAKFTSTVAKLEQEIKQAGKLI